MVPFDTMAPNFSGPSFTFFSSTGIELSPSIAGVGWVSKARHLCLRTSSLIWPKQRAESNTRHGRQPGYDNVGRAWIYVGQVQNSVKLVGTCTNCRDSNCLSPSN
jgi:hypothetical protein